MTAIASYADALIDLSRWAAEVSRLSKVRGSLEYTMAQRMFEQAQRHLKEALFGLMDEWADEATEAGLELGEVGT